MTTQVYNVDSTTTQAQQDALLQTILANNSDGTAYAVEAPAGDAQGAAIAQSVMSQVMARQGTTTSGATIPQGTDSSNTPTTFWQKAELGLMAGVQGITNPIGTAKVAAPAAKQAASGALGWIESNIGNYSMIGLGVVLGIGALLVSQKQTIINLAKGVVGK